MPGVAREKIDEQDIRIDEIQAEIRESIDRAKALVAKSDLFVRDGDDMSAAQASEGPGASA